MWELLVSAILLFSLWDFSEAQTDYCSICSDHTMCKYPSDIPSPKCHGVRRAKLSEEDIKIIVDTHNMVRKRVASGNETSGRPGPLPPASDMWSLTWDEELATIAMRWALQCNFFVDSCRNVARFNVGQNMYHYKCIDCAHDPPDWEFAIYSWYKTIENLPKYNLSPFQYASNYGPYTQLVWSRTMKVGCAHISYMIPYSYWEIKVYICNYGPTGNIVGPQTEVYRIGSPCLLCQQLCPDGVLCSLPTQQNNVVAN